MPLSVRLLLSRLSRIVVSPRRVSPWKTGLGNFTESYPRLPSVVPKVSSSTWNPPTRARVKRLLNSGRPWIVCLANSWSRCSGWGFIVSDVNSTLSDSVTVRVNGCL